MSISQVVSTLRGKLLHHFPSSPAGAQTPPMKRPPTPQQHAQPTPPPAPHHPIARTPSPCPPPQTHRARAISPSPMPSSSRKTLEVFAMDQDDDEAHFAEDERDTSHNHTRKRQSRPRKSKNLGIPLAPSEKPVYRHSDPEVILHESHPRLAKRRLSDGFAVGQFQVMIDPSWTFADKIIHTRLLTFALSLPHSTAETVVRGDIPLLTDAQIIKALLVVGYGTEDRWIKVATALGAETHVHFIQTRGEEIVHRLMTEDGFNGEG
ncbi:hypothetical protein BJ742DRAFT_815570 [Cladochytrium replicatum]|nr:hypothetical protein BJ742DRAFT_815570 [Cladochytrium replicatum]